jgi:hypothetical protein
MDPAKEALGRVIIADFEERRLKEKALVRAARGRLWGVVIRIALVLGAFAYFRRSHSPDWAEALPSLAVLYLIFTLISSYRTQEEIRRLRAEVDQLKSKAGRVRE